MSGADQFTIVGENIHTTRALSKKGKRIKILKDGREGIRFKNAEGKTRFLRVPLEYRKKQDYEEGRIKHVQLAVQAGLWGEGDDRERGIEYIHSEARRQVAAGAHFLDLNVDEVSLKPEEQQEAMRWLVPIVGTHSPIPPSIDSSNPETIEVGLKAYDGGSGRPLLNSAALERPEVLDLVREFDSRVIITASGEGGMPDDEEERIANIGEMMGIAETKGIPKRDIYIDALVFPIAVDARFGNHYLEAVRQSRKLYGDEVHILGGLSNVSFGIPQRKLVNEVFISLAVEAGADGAIMDPLQNRLEEVFNLDKSTEAYRFAHEMLTGKDDFCEKYIEAWRAGKLG